MGGSEKEPLVDKGGPADEFIRPVLLDLIQHCLPGKFRKPRLVCRQDSGIFDPIQEIAFDRGDLDPFGVPHAASDRDGWQRATAHPPGFRAVQKT